jgi:hypothetical protein
MDEYDDERKSSRRESITTRLTYLVIGGGIGAMLALLFAPRPGHEVRSDIADAIRGRLGEQGYLRKRIDRAYQDEEMFIDEPDPPTAAADLGGNETKGDYD